jgi:peptide deformylase
MSTTRRTFELTQWTKPAAWAPATAWPGSDQEVRLMDEDLTILHYPDPRLRRISRPVSAFDEPLRSLAARMLELMRAHRGVGLAAPQVGHDIRLFVMNATGQPGDDKIYINPVLVDATGSEVAEEGCLSLPDVTADIDRSKSVRMQAQGLSGEAITEVAENYVARIWQHEVDHLNGMLILDRMGAVAKMACRKALKDLEEHWVANRPATVAPKAARRL